MKTPLAILTLVSFLINSVIGPLPLARAGEFRLPAPGVMVHLSPEFNPPILKGIKVYSDNPFRFDFILDKGDGELSNDQLKQESSKLIKYFLASLTIPEKDLWVNLSPYEKDRIIPQSFGLTEMGRDLLGEDYLLKQITASLIYPEGETGKKFWKRIYEEATKRYGTTNIPVNTFNKVWIVPEKAVVYENVKAGTAYVVESKLKVMLEQDYLSLTKHEGIQSEQTQSQEISQLGAQIVREIVIPELTTEVNENKNFIKLRQVYNSLILATWYKKKIKDSILSQVYADKNKTAGVNIDDPQEKEKIYQQYLQAFKKGVYNYIKEDIDPTTQEITPRKYFSGGAFLGLELGDTSLAMAHMEVTNKIPDAAILANGQAILIKSRFDQAMISKNEVLAILEANNWRLGLIKDLLGIKQTQNYYDFFVQVGLQEELKLKLKESLERNAWTIVKVAKEFEISTTGIYSLIDKFSIVRNLGKAQALKILGEHSWKFGDLKDQLGMKSLQDYYQFFKQIGLLEELKAKIEESLIRNNWSLDAVGREFAVSSKVIRLFIEKFPLVRKGADKNKVLTTLEANDWNLSKLYVEYNMSYKESYYEFLSQLGLLQELKEKLKESLERNNWNLTKVANNFGVTSIVIRSLINKFSLVRNIDKQKLLAILEKNNWQMGDLTEQLGIKKNQGYYDFFQQAGALEELKARLIGSLDKNNWIIMKVAEDFKVAANAIDLLIDKFSLVPNHQIIKLLDEHGWRIDEVKDQLGFKKTKGYYKFFEDLGILDELKVKLKESLERNNWNTGDVARDFGISYDAINLLIEKFSLGPKIDRTKALTILREHNWRFGDLNQQLGKKSKQDYKVLFQQLGLLDELKQKLTESLQRNNWAIRRVAEDFGVSVSVVSLLIDKFSIVRSLDKTKALEIINQHNWKLGEVDKQLGMKGNEQYYEFFEELGLLDELKQKLTESLQKNNWAIRTVANELDVSDTSIKSLIKKFSLVQNIDKSKVLALLNQHGWKLGQIYDQLGMAYGENINNFFEKIGLLEEFKSKLKESLEKNNWSTKDVAEEFGVSKRTLLDVLERFSLVRQGIDKAKALEILKMNNWRLGESNEQLGMGYKEGYYNFLQKLGLLEELKTELKKSLERNGWSIPKVAKEFVVTYMVIYSFMERFGIENEVEKRTTETVETTQGIIHDFSKQLDPRQIQDLVIRYGKDIKEFIWAIAGSRLKDGYDSDLVNKVLEEEMIFLGTDESNTDSNDSVGEGLGEVKVITEDNIKSLASFMQKKIEEIDLSNNTNIEAYKIARQHAISLILQLEEERFFREFYDAQQQDVLAETKSAIEKAREEGEGIHKEALNELLVEFEQITLEYQKLRPLLNPKTRLNLYQLVGIHRMLQKRGVILADEMGLGKTLETLATFLMSDQDEMLVLAPNQVLERWMQDIGEHLNVPLEVVNLSNIPIDTQLSNNPLVQIPESITESQKRYEYFYSTNRPKLEKGKRRIILLNYEALPYYEQYREEHDLQRPNVGFLALDEAHWLKNINAQRTSAVFSQNGEAPMQASFKVLMTGTPIENKVRDLFEYLRFLSYGSSNPVYSRIAQMDGKTFSNIYRPKNLEKMSELVGYLREVMIRRLKVNVLHGLPNKHFIDVVVDPSRGTMQMNGDKPIYIGNFSAQARLYQEALENPDILNTFKTQDLEDRENGANVLTQLLRLEQLALDPETLGLDINNIKLEALKYLVKDRLGRKTEHRPDGEQVLIFTSFSSVSRHVRDELEKLFPGKIAYVDGGIKQGERQNEIKDFQSGKKKIMVATIGSAGVGKNLTQADAVIFLHLPWKPSTFDQAVDRVHRIDELRNYPGRSIDIIQLTLEASFSIDRMKQRIIRRKRIINEMITNGNLSPELLAALKSTDDELFSLLDKSSDPIVFDDYEQSIRKEFLLLLGQALQSGQTEIWDRIAPLYALLVERKASLFGNMASLDVLGQSAGELGLLTSPQNPKKVLDLGSGPSTLYRAYLKMRSKLNAEGLYLDIFDYDVSLEMLGRGIFRKERQLQGTFEDLKQLPSDSYDMINLSYAYRWAKHPAELLRQAHRILKEDGLATIVLPSSNQFSETFLSSIRELGFELKTSVSDKLISQLDEKTYSALKVQYGKDYADDVAKAASGKFTYLIVRKMSKGTLADAVIDQDVLIGKVSATIDRDKVNRMIKEDVESPIIPFDGQIKGELLPWEEEEIGYIKPKAILKKIKTVLSAIEILMRESNDNERLNKEKAENLNMTILEKLDDIQDYLATIKEVPIGTNAVLEQWKDRKSVRIWLGHHDMNSIVDEIKGDLDRAMGAERNMGGIDFTANKIPLEIRNSGNEIKFHLDATQLIQLQNAPGFVPVIINIQPMNNLKEFLGLKESSPSQTTSA